MPGTLFVVATPIGNLEDLTFRALRTLREVDLIAAEDTRRTAKLLSHYNIHTPMVSIHAHNERREAPGLLERIRSGTTVALVSDAGTPGIADPGEYLVRLAREQGIPVSPVPGPSSIAAALSVSGQPASQFVFMGFPPRSGRERSDWIQEVSSETRTVVAFESPHRITKTMADLTGVLGEKQIQVHREITKVHESFIIYPTSLPESAENSRGEFVLVISPSAELAENRSKEAETVATALSIIGCLTINGAFDSTHAIALASKAVDLDPRTVKNAWKKARIRQKQQLD
jgi:16S rRNA (cytidine1402-2'-O)-methyltransferase